MNDPNTWNTAITDVNPGRIRVRGYPIEELMGRVSFTEVIHLVFLGELPSPGAAKALEAVLVAAVDHGGGSPSALTARTVASAGAPIGTAAAAGLLAINRFHGAVIEDCMHAMEDVHRLIESGASRDEAAEQVVARHREQGRRLSGFGHRMHKLDPRPERLWEICRSADVDLRGYDLTARAIERAVSAAVGRSIPMNLDAAIGVVFAGLGVVPEMANPLFTLARFVGLNAQAWEESTRMRPMRAIYPRSYEYDGPAERHLGVAQQAHGSDR